MWSGTFVLFLLNFDFGLSPDLMMLSEAREHILEIGCSFFHLLLCFRLLIFGYLATGNRGIRLGDVIKALPCAVMLSACALTTIFDVNVGTY